MIMKLKIIGFGMINHLLISLNGIQDSLIIVVVEAKTVVLFSLMVNGTMQTVI